METLLQSKPSNFRKTELIAGLTTFFTMSYIVVVNPAILATEGTGIAFDGALTATVLLSFLMTLMMGLYAKLPFAVAPGMGINAFFTFTLILGYKIPWQTALGMVFWSGVLFVLLSVTPARVFLAEAIPKSLRCASAVGIGIFLTFIGLKNTGIIASDPVTFVRPGAIDRNAVLSFVGLLIMLYLLKRKSPFAFLAGMAVVAGVSWSAGWTHLPKSLFSRPDFKSVFLKMDVWGALKPAFFPAIISMLFTDLFDSIATFMGVSQAAGLLDKNGSPKNLKQGLIVDAFATMSAGLLGTSSGTAYIESSAGIEIGGRTGLTSVVTALCFLPCLFLAPLAASVPGYATAPVLIIVGALMFRTIGEVSLRHVEDLVPVFLTIVLIPLTFSITQGMLWGFITHVLLYVMAGRRKEIHPGMYLISALSAGLLILEHH